MIRCERSDLPRTMCGHCLRVPDEQQTIGPPVAAPRFNPAPILALDYSSRRWRTTSSKPIVCDHGKADGAALCTACETRLAAALSDVPALVADLEVHHAKGNVFLDRGVPQHPEDEDEPRVEESPLPYAAAGSDALAGLARALDGDPTRRALRHLADWRSTMRLPHLEEFAGRVSRAVLKGFRVIDVTPYLTHYGVCPTCGKDIRIEKVQPGDDVVCSCGYSADEKTHRENQMEIGADSKMTLTKVVQVLNDAGEHTSRQEVENLIYREGLPREQIPVWSNGRLVKVWHYRLGDVRDWRKKKRRST